MQTRDEYPVGVPCWIDLDLPDPEGGMRFYGGVFGWTFVDRTPEGSPTPYYVARLKGGDVAGVGSLVGGRPLVAEWSTYVRVDSAVDASARVTAAGGQVLAEPADVSGAGRVAAFADPDGAAFRVWEPTGWHGAQRVNEPGTWNFNDLNTHDTERAKSFYRAVFGWEANSVDFGFEVSTMWRVPDYGDFLEKINPGTQERHDESGVPDGFSDAVGWMQQLAADTPTGVTPHWSVSFAVADTDAVTERATSLGGDVVVPPFDAGDSRIAVLRDPQGAAFVVNRYAPSA
jgi:uncharacterized protein